MLTDHSRDRPLVGVGLAVMDADRRLLFGLRCGSHGADTWAFPGGHVERGQSPELAAASELIQEAGISVSPAAIVPMGRGGLYTYDVFPEKEYVTLWFAVGVPRGTEAVRIEREKCLEWRWCDRHSLPSPRFRPVDNMLAKGVNLWDAARLSILRHGKQAPWRAPVSPLVGVADDSVGAFRIFDSIYVDGSDCDASGRELQGQECVIVSVTEEPNPQLRGVTDTILTVRFADGTAYPAWDTELGARVEVPGPEWSRSLSKSSRSASSSKRVRSHVR